MLPEQEKQIYKNFPELVKDCDLEKLMKSMSGDACVSKIMDNVKLETDRRHNNRTILFQLLKTNSPTIFHDFVSTLRAHKFEELANKLENKPTISHPKHSTKCVRPPDPSPNETYIYASNEMLKINVRHSIKFSDNGEYCYRTRSKNRGQVLIINNILFDTDIHKTRKGAEIDEMNLKELFEKFGMGVEMYRNLRHDEIQRVVEKFSQKEYETPPDLGIVIIMSHGEKINNKTVIIGSDGKGVEEELIIMQFNNNTCSLFRNKPKVLIFNICRGDLLDNLSHLTQITESDSAAFTPEKKHEEDQRYFSDLIICHPSVEGFQSHRDTVRGCWYIELLCKVFMEEAHGMDVETMLKKMELGLKKRISEKMTRQTSTFLNIAFKTCYLNPGIYEEEGILFPMKN